MRRWLAGLFISAYLAVLGYGIVAHTLGINAAQHPFMYFIVWDMFCGWSAYAERAHVIAEGESGAFYELAPAPWGEIKPYGPSGRHNYDSFYHNLGRVATNTLAHTRHEPIARIFVIQETWAKKYELPDSIWNARYRKPKDVQSYYQLRSELAGDGSIIRTYANWFDEQGMMTVVDNPRLQAEVRNGQSFFVVDQVRGDSSEYFTRNADPGFSPISAPLGN